MADDLAQQLDAAQGDDLARLREIASRLHERGVDFRVEHGQVVTDRALDRDTETVIDLGRTHLRLGIVSDTHGGSKFEQLSALRAFYRHADEQGVDLFVHGGDLTQGSDKMHRDQYLGVHAHGADAQVGYVVGTFPRSGRPGIKTYVISGNHDDSFLADGGTNVARQITAARDDLVYVGQDAAYLTVDGLRMYLVHPDGGGSYAKSYKPQKIAEALPIERRAALVLIGHYHVAGWFREKDTHVLMLPSFQSQYSWLARRSLHPDVGGVILDVWLDDDGRPARVVHELVSFRPRESDWDHAVSDAVSHGWSPEGLTVGG